MTKEDRMKKSLRLTALLLAAVIALASAGECVMASTAAGATKASAEKSSEDAVETEETETTAEGEDVEEDDSAEEEETTKAAKKKKKTVKKKGNLDRYIGLDEKYMVLATAKRYVRVYRKMDKSSRVVGAFRKNNCIIMNTESLKEGRQYKWIKVYSKGKSGIGYIPLSWVSLRIIDTETFGLDTSSEKNRQRIKICQYGLPYVGTRFKMGGKSLTQGIDCSTFARQAFRNAGVMVVLPLQPGDFPTTEKRFPAPSSNPEICFSIRIMHTIWVSDTARSISAEDSLSIPPVIRAAFIPEAVSGSPESTIVIPLPASSEIS